MYSNRTYLLDYSLNHEEAWGQPGTAGEARHLPFAAATTTSTYSPGALAVVQRESARLKECNERPSNTRFSRLGPNAPIWRRSGCCSSVNSPCFGFSHLRRVVYGGLFANWRLDIHHARAAQGTGGQRVRRGLGVTTRGRDVRGAHAVAGLG